MEENYLNIKIGITKFAEKHFDPKSTGTKVLDKTIEEFLKTINAISNSYNSGGYFINADSAMLDGYADFCKILIVPNFTDAKTGTVPIDYDNLQNYTFLKSGYNKRRGGELPVLTRSVTLPVSAPKAKYISIILYSKGQIDKESIAEYNKLKGTDKAIESPEGYGYDWGIVAILGTMTKEEQPMTPATMLRNYMPIEFGGSGMKFPVLPSEPHEDDFLSLGEYDDSYSNYEDRLEAYHMVKDKFESDYNKSVKFWSNNALIG